MTRIGTISPDDLKIHVTQTVGLSSIFLFWAIDWGMENCELHVALAPVDRPITLALYRLDATVPVDISTLSKLSCAMDDVLVFELACSEDEPSSSCDIEWWQAHKETAPG
ncbi:hypothetical protein DFJ58DRAFT_652493 [Suillus subalutaceus]|uniref:uncharacterized protein n=1 Tax=Suillus subalutaceus TaxID=48586 RepID=UPI001B867180|nr:uncharacterized protein DFJ58DRAFT_652493 [Suillus subalutaceus]KAG1871319.1 hypothetical protein DFJ58DRAFT_652493 [Suillus subalutaceus]